jgi:hypothetical protein
MKCIFCFSDESKIYFDKKERPYYYCNLCSGRIFLRSKIALQAILVWTEAARSLTQQEFVQALQRVEQTQVMQNESIKKWVEKSRVTQDVVVATKED